MPAIKFQHVVSFSSEDKNFPATNLLKPEGTSKWRCAKAGEKSASVTIQLEKSTKILSLDIGNNGSAFVEVLVGRASMASEDDFKVLLIASSFMTPLEARSNNGLTRVRMFDNEKLSQPTRDEHWDKVKVICTQPFNRTSNYGLSFIKLLSPGTPNDGTTTPSLKKETSVSKLGGFKLKPEESSPVRTGSLFANRGKEEVKTNIPLSGAAAVRAASREVDGALGTTPIKHIPKPSSPIVHDRTPKPSTTKNGHDVKEATPTHKAEKRSREDGHSESSRKPSASDKISKREDPPPRKKSRSDAPKPKTPFRQILKGVTFVMSGFKNPYRGELRDKALEMGAKYKPDWDKKCTHLICAFSNTPKFQEVLGKGRIVTKHWLLDCYEKKKLYPWRKYRLDGADSPSGSGSSGDESEEEYRPVPKKITPHKSPLSKTIAHKTPQRSVEDSPSTSKASETKYSPRKLKEDEDSTDVEMDTDDEIEKIKNDALKAKSKQETNDAIYDQSTDEETDDDIKPNDKIHNTPPSKTVDNGSKDIQKDEPGSSSDSDDEGLPELPDLPDFFAEKYFFFYGKFAAADRRTLVRYITAFDGTVEEYMSEKIHFVITESEWDDNFDDALKENPEVAFVRPAWVYECNDKSKLVPHQKYIVTAS
ncbi:unnamed protein product [Owenia fusiformis]|uniref:DNA repair protein XRCC1 n=1 Tax=Owenia fusiformis TaxID=6347 RepID=A0A8J1XVC0_OWEFU|nr:unnamed protein product [Owenia fusiformis]